MRHEEPDRRYHRGIDVEAPSRYEAIKSPNTKHSSRLADNVGKARGQDKTVLQDWRGRFISWTDKPVFRKENWQLHNETSQRNCLVSYHQQGDLPL